MDFRFSPSLLDQFNNHLLGKWNKTEQDVIDSINRVPFKASEAMAKGTCFHTLTDGRELPKLNRKTKTYDVEIWKFKKDVVEEIRNNRTDGKSEVYVERTMEIGEDRVLLYGYIDTMKGQTSIDVKTTSRYRGPGSFYSSLQWRTYNYCAGTEKFQYIVTDFRHVYYEDYTQSKEAEDYLRSIVSQFIDFIKANRDKITHERVFDYSPEDLF